MGARAKPPPRDGGEGGPSSVGLGGRGTGDGGAEAVGCFFERLENGCFRVTRQRTCRERTDSQRRPRAVAAHCAWRWQFVVRKRMACETAEIGQ